MSQYLVYFLKDNSIAIKFASSDKHVAETCVENVAIEHIKEQQGIQQVKVCKSGQTVKELEGDLFKDGLYIIQNNEMVDLYEKITTKNWLGRQFININKIGSYGVTEYAFADDAKPILQAASKIPAPPPPKIVIPPQSHKIVKATEKEKIVVAESPSYLDELTNKLKNGSLNLKKVVTIEKKAVMGTVVENKEEEIPDCESCGEIEYVIPDEYFDDNDYDGNDFISDVDINYYEELLDFSLREVVIEETIEEDLILLPRSNKNF